MALSSTICAWRGKLPRSRIGPNTGSLFSLCTMARIIIPIAEYGIVLCLWSMVHKSHIRGISEYRKARSCVEAVVLTMCIQPVSAICILKRMPVFAFL